MKRKEGGWQLLLVALVCISVGCRVQRGLDKDKLQLRFLGAYEVPSGTVFNNTVVGGLSGIDYSAPQNLFYFISDDRSDRNPARIYAAQIFFSETGIDTVAFRQVITLRQRNGAVYPGHAQDSVNAPDPEALRLHPTTKGWVWSSEGERLTRNGRTILLNPAITLTNAEGMWQKELPLPAALHMTTEDRGPRRNGALESLSYDPSGSTLFACMEEPLYQDGPRAGTRDTAGWVRLLRYSSEDSLPAQYAYRIDPVIKAPNPPGAFAVNGVTDILAIGAKRLLVTERSFSTGQPGCNVRLYLADLSGAEPLPTEAALNKMPPRRPVQKKKVLDFDTLGFTVHNIEGACLGPRLRNGKQSLLFVADDNFSGRERTQLLLFEVD